MVTSLALQIVVLYCVAALLAWLLVTYFWKHDRKILCLVIPLAIGATLFSMAAALDMRRYNQGIVATIIDLGGATILFGIVTVAVQVLRRRKNR